MNAPSKEISKRVRKLIGWTQRQLAERLMVSRNYVALIEAGTRTPSIRLHRQLERLLSTVEHRDATIDIPSSTKSVPVGNWANRMQAEIENEFSHLQRLAGDDLGRLGWLREELRALRARVHWEIGAAETVSQEKQRMQSARCHTAPATHSKPGGENPRASAHFTQFRS